MALVKISLRWDSSIPFLRSQGEGRSPHVTDKRTSCACRNSNSHVQMMKSAEKWRRQNAANSMNCSPRWRILVDRKVHASLVIVVCTENPIRVDDVTESPK